MGIPYLLTFITLLISWCCTIFKYGLFLLSFCLIKCDWCNITWIVRQWYIIEEYALYLVFLLVARQYNVTFFPDLESMYLFLPLSTIIVGRVYCIEELHWIFYYLVIKSVAETIQCARHNKPMHKKWNHTQNWTMAPPLWQPLSNHCKDETKTSKNQDFLTINPIISTG